MPDNSSTLHEDASVIGSEVVNRHRAIASIMEELEAVDWYGQRVAATDDPELAQVLAHSRDEEKEHAAMTLEWLRRHDPELDAALRLYLFTEGSLIELEHQATNGDAPDPTAETPRPSSLAIGSLRTGKELL